MRHSRSAALVAATLRPFAFAQTSTDCNPLDATCPADTGLTVPAFLSDFTKGSSSNASWSAAAYTTITYGDQGAEFSIPGPDHAPTVQTDFYFFFGRVDVKMKAAPGTGIVSSIVLESDDLDEIDFEFLGGDTTQVETNFFGKGNTTLYNRAIYYPVTNPQSEFHTYSVDWTSDRLQFLIDGSVVRTLAYDDPLTLGGANYPQTPMRLKLGNWCGGCSGEPAGTVEWAGGNTTFDNAPYVMYVESVNIENYNPADQYVYQDNSGSWQKIGIVNNGQTANPTGSGTSVPATAVATSSVKGSASGNSTAAVPTSSASVASINLQTGGVVSTTITGSSYSMNTASASAQNTGKASATATGSRTATGSGSAQQTASSAASANAVMATGSLLSLVLSFFLL